MSLFDPEAFLSTTTTEANEKRPPLPVEEYLAVIGKPTARQSQGKKDPTKTYTFIDVPLTIEVPADLQGAMSLPPNVKVTDSFILDLTDAGSLDMSPGKNGGMRRYREALGMNRPGEAFSLAQMEGNAVRVRIKHELYNEEIQERVGGVAKP